MSAAPTLDVSYFPGCSLATTAKENNQSLIECCRKMGLNLIDLADWNCCGSSSAHSINHRLALDLACRNLSLAPPGRPLVAACPSCTLRLKHAQHILNKRCGRPGEISGDVGTALRPGFEGPAFLRSADGDGPGKRAGCKRSCADRLDLRPLLRVHAQPPFCVATVADQHGIMEKTLSKLGLRPLHWAYASQCCGTFLTVARPDIVTPKVNAILQGAAESGAECIVTACAMCHMNLEVRCTLKNPVPIFHFSEILSMAFGVSRNKDWFSRHLIDPRPLLKSKGLTNF